MQNKRKVFLAVLTMILLGILASPLSVFAAEAEETAQPALYATFWALIPPVVAIALALITTPNTVHTTTESITAGTGPIPPLVTAVRITKAPTMITSPWAKFSIFAIPYTIV